MHALITFLFVEIAGFIILFFFSRNQFDEVLLSLSKKDRLQKILIPIGLFLMKGIHLRNDTNYMRRLERKVRELHGSKSSHSFLQIHLAQKVIYLCLSLFLILLLVIQVGFDFSTLTFVILIPLLILFAHDKQLDSALQKRRNELQLEFPEFLNKLILLVNAGLNTQSAIIKILEESKKSNALYVELNMIMNEINSGKGEFEAYENFAHRCKIHEITSFVTIMIQNMRKGNDAFISLLRVHSGACWENRKYLARKLGEEASTKLLFPMMLVFLAILAMLMTPAMMQINF